MVKSFKFLFYKKEKSNYEHQGKVYQQEIVTANFSQRPTELFHPPQSVTSLHQQSGRSTESTHYPEEMSHTSSTLKSRVSGMQNFRLLTGGSQWLPVWPKLQSHLTTLELSTGLGGHSIGHCQEIPPPIPPFP